MVPLNTSSKSVPIFAENGNLLGVRLPNSDKIMTGMELEKKLSRQHNQLSNLQKRVSKKTKKRYREGLQWQMRIVNEAIEELKSAERIFNLHRPYAPPVEEIPNHAEEPEAEQVVEPEAEPEAEQFVQPEEELLVVEPQAEEVVQPEVEPHFQEPQVLQPVVQQPNALPQIQNHPKIEEAIQLPAPKAPTVKNYPPKMFDEPPLPAPAKITPQPDLDKKSTIVQVQKKDTEVSQAKPAEKDKDYKTLKYLVGGAAIGLALYGGYKFYQSRKSSSLPSNPHIDQDTKSDLDTKSDFDTNTDKDNSIEGEIVADNDIVIESDCDDQASAQASSSSSTDSPRTILRPNRPGFLPKICVDKPKEWSGWGFFEKGRYLWKQVHSLCNSNGIKNYSIESDGNRWYVKWNKNGVKYQQHIHLQEVPQASYGMSVSSSTVGTSSQGLADGLLDGLSHLTTSMFKKLFG